MGLKIEIFSVRTLCMIPYEASSNNGRKIHSRKFTLRKCLSFYKVPERHLTKKNSDINFRILWMTKISVFLISKYFLLKTFPLYEFWLIFCNKLSEFLNFKPNSNESLCAVRPSLMNGDYKTLSFSFRYMTDDSANDSYQNIQFRDMFLISLNTILQSSLCSFVLFKVYGFLAMMCWTISRKNVSPRSLCLE